MSSRKNDYIVVLKLSLDSVLPGTDSPESWDWARIIEEKVELLSCQKMREKEERNDK